jgi:hypothetical protein
MLSNSRVRKGGIQLLERAACKTLPQDAAKVEGQKAAGRQALSGHAAPEQRSAMSTSLQLFIAAMLAAVAFGFFAFVAANTDRPMLAAVLAAAIWLLVAIAVGMLVTVVVL